ncbi:hypothetical protein FWK35_00008102 [Aphis craccivora]|uniref:Uncharacterized protein n=1 Tax=Aphis craccivora TaxID=307492 RepID=A0A6G0YTX4_APHCR|nr:hypothetical protein FWK35_00008102 [Aphis craccivora]
MVMIQKLISVNT